jgi:hypothetical protein
MALFDKLAQISATIAKVEIKLGVPQRRHLFLRKTVYDDVSKEVSTEDILLTPKPYITSVNPRYVDLDLSVNGLNSIFKIAANDLEVIIPRTYPPSLFEGTIKAIVDPPVDEEGNVIYSNPLTKTFTNVNWWIVKYFSDKDKTNWKIIIGKEADG